MTPSVLRQIAAKVGLARFSADGLGLTRTQGSNIPLGNQPFAGYIAMIPGVQSVNTGSAKSLAGNPLAEAYPSALTGRGTLTDAQMWANAGYMSTVNVAGGCFEIPLSAYAPNLKAGGGQLIAFVVNAAAPASTTRLISQSNGATGAQGFDISALTTGKLSVATISAAGTSSIGSGTGTFCDSTDHYGMFYIHPSGYACLWLDGEIDTIFSINPNFPLGITTPTAPLTFGAIALVGNNTGVAMAAKFKGIHLISFGTMPLNLNQIAKKLRAEPMTPLRNSDVILSVETDMLYWAAGQSNEGGAGNTPGIVGPLGVPDRDAQNLTASRSIKTGLAKRLAARGKTALWGNSAMGSTGIADAWVGRIRNWANNSNILGGSYVLNAGTVWKCTNAAGFSALSTIAPAAGTGADTITWTSLGAPTAEDTSVLAGTGIYPATSARFDPNSLLATAEARAALAVSSTTERVAMISIGQGDRYAGVSRAAYADAIQKVAAYHLARSATKVLICMTVRSAVISDYSTYNGGGAANADNDTSDHWYDRHLLPGRADALAVLSNNPRVFAGWDWATGIGPVTGQTSPTAIGVKTSDGLVHMTDATYESLAVPLADAALQACGV
jgi:hypothetical protein